MAGALANQGHLARFLEAQEGVYPAVLGELAAGEKRTHWIWYIFPQIQGLGQSAMSRHYAIRTVGEAAAYAEHPVLGARLRKCTELVIAVEGRGIGQILHPPDDLKFHACMTLFARASGEAEPWRMALQKFFGGKLHQATLDLLAALP